MALPLSGMRASNMVSVHGKCGIIGHLLYRCQGPLICLPAQVVRECGRWPTFESLLQICSLIDDDRLIARNTMEKVKDKFSVRDLYLVLVKG